MIGFIFIMAIAIGWLLFALLLSASTISRLRDERDNGWAYHEGAPPEPYT